MLIDWTRNLSELYAHLSQETNQTTQVCSREVPYRSGIITQYAVATLNDPEIHEGAQNLHPVNVRSYKQIIAELRHAGLRLSGLINRGNIKQAEELANTGISVNDLSGNGSTPLIQAIKKERLHLVEMLMHAGADINLPDKNGDTPLMHAIKEDNKPIIKYLLAMGANVHAENEKLETAFSIAVAKEDLRMIKILILAGFDINEYGWNLSSTPFLDVISKADPEIIKFLLDNADLQKTDSNGNTPLIKAVLISDPEIAQEMVKLLISAGAQLNTPNAEGHTPISIAIAHNDFLMAQLLKDSGADLDIPNNAGYSPLSTAILNGRTISVKFLIELGAQINTISQNGNIPLLLAIKKGHLEIVKLLLKFNVDIHQTDKKGNTPLTVAAAMGHLKIATSLIEAGSAIDKLNKEGYTPLIYAKIFHHQVVAHLLIKNGADNSYAEEFLKRKMLAHVTGITDQDMKSTSIVHNEMGPVKIKLTLPPLIYVIPKTTQHISDFLHTHKAAKEIASDKKSLIEDAFNNIWPIKKLTKKEVRNRIDRNEPTFFLLSSGEGSPEMAVILTGNQLILCNRGLGSNKDTTEVYDYPPNRMKILISVLTSNQLNMGKLHSLFLIIFNKSVPTIKQKMIAPFLTKENLTFRDVQSKIKQESLVKSASESYSQKRHGAENRPVTLQKTIFLALLRNIRVTDPKTVYKEFTLSQRIREITEYIESTPIEKQDRLLVKKALGKLKRKLSPYYSMQNKIKGDPALTKMILSLIANGSLYGVNFFQSRL